MRHSLVVAIAGTALLAACSEQSPVELAGVPEPEFAISDGASGGNEHFYFLPPMVKSPSYSGTFDPTLSPVVVISQGETVLGELEAQLDEDNEQYHANWHTDDFGLSPDLMYRLSIQVDGYEVGFADIDMVENGSGLRNVQTDEYLGLVDGRTLPVKFRLEEGAIPLETWCDPIADVCFSLLSVQSEWIPGLYPYSPPDSWRLSGTFQGRFFGSDLPETFKYYVNLGDAAYGGPGFFYLGGPYVDFYDSDDSENYATKGSIQTMTSTGPATVYGSDGAPPASPDLGVWAIGTWSAERSYAYCGTPVYYTGPRCLGY